MRADRSLCVDSVGLLRHCWRCGLAGRGAIESLALANWKPIGKIHDNANTQNQALRARVALLLLRTTPVRSPGGSYSAINRKLPLSY